MGVSVTTAAERVALVGDFDRDTARRAATALATEALRTRDSCTADHSDDVLTLSDAVGRRLGLDELLLRQLASGAQLHDIGKVAMPLSILNKPTALSEAEWTVIREHTVIGERILRSVPAMSDIATIVRHSHEHWDGSGYPDGLSGEAIPLPSRVILCADAFHAMRCDRPYRRGRAAEAALAEIEACAGAQFDPAVADAFLAVADDARNGIPLQSDRLRKRRLIALLTTLAIGTGSAFAAIPEVRDAIKSIFATGTPTSQAASDTLPAGEHQTPEHHKPAPLEHPRPGHQTPEHQTPDHKPAPLEHAKAPEPVTDDEKRRRRGPRARQTPDGSPSPTPSPNRIAPVDGPGRALGRDVPTPRAPVQTSKGGRTDPPALGLEAGPNGLAKGHSK